MPLASSDHWELANLGYISFMNGETSEKNILTVKVLEGDMVISINRQDLLEPIEIVALITMALLGLAVAVAELMQPTV